MKLNELEIKIQIESEAHFNTIYDHCHRFFGSPQSHTLQLDEYYDTLDGQLKKQDLVIRIRTSNQTKTIALKSPRVKLSSGATQRIELEFLSAETDVNQQLLNQGLSPKESAEKERWTFVHKECEIVLDKLPFIGAFIEIEGPSEAAIHEVIALLNLSSCQVINKNYGELMLEKFHELQLPVDHISATFASEIEFKTAGITDKSVCFDFINVSNADIKSTSASWPKNFFNFEPIDDVPDQYNIDE